jgi:uncharacterized protein GlcG (DUF336 family)
MIHRLRPADPASSRARHRARLLVAALFATTLLSSPALSQTRARTDADDVTLIDDTKAAASDVRDPVGMFDPDAVRRAREALRQIEKAHGLPILIETIESLRGQQVGEVAERRREQENPRGIYILMAQKEHRLSPVLVPDRFAARLPEARREAVREAFLGEFKQDDFNAGLLRGVRALASALGEGTGDRPAPAAATGRPESARGHEGLGKPLVERNRVHLNLAGAHVILAAAAEKAEQMGLKVNVTVVDDGGHPIAFARMDGARPASAYTSMTKATTAATFRQATGPLPAGSPNPDVLLNLSLQNAAAASGGKVTTLLGGLTVLVDGQVIGGVGVGGGTGEQDTEVAKAGIAALMKQLQAPEKKEPAGER